MKKRAVKTEARNAREAIEKMLIEKKLSNKIDYEVVKSLNIIGSLPQPPKIEESSTKAEDSLISKRTNTEPDDGVNIIFINIFFYIFKFCLRKFD